MPDVQREERFRGVVATVAGALKGAGFKKTRTKWERRRGQLIDAVALERSPWNDVDRLRFELQWGVTVVGAIDVLYDVPTPRSVSPVDCLLWSRSSTQWEAGAPRCTPEAVLGELTAAVAWLESFSTGTDVAASLASSAATEEEWPGYDGMRREHEIAALLASGSFAPAAARLEELQGDGLQHRNQFVARLAAAVAARQKGS